MRKSIILLTSIIFLSCNQPVEKTCGIPAEEKVKTEVPVNVDLIEKSLKDRGYQAFRYKEDDTT